MPDLDNVKQLRLLFGKPCLGIRNKLALTIEIHMLG
jgi:hypothetical protein